MKGTSLWGSQSRGWRPSHPLKQQRWESRQKQTKLPTAKLKMTLFGVCLRLGFWIIALLLDPCALKVSYKQRSTPPSDVGHLSTGKHHYPQANAPWLQLRKMKPQNTMTRRRCCVSSNFTSVAFYSCTSTAQVTEHCVLCNNIPKTYFSQRKEWSGTHVYSLTLLPPKENLMGSAS